MASSAGHTTDLEIYQAATYGNASIMMMLDNSGSMDSRSISEDYNVNGLTLTTFQGTLYCTRNGNIVSNPIRSDNLVQRLYDDTGNITSESKNYSVDFCLVNGSRYLRSNVTSENGAYSLVCEPQK